MKNMKEKKKKKENKKKKKKSTCSEWDFDDGKRRGGSVGSWVVGCQRERSGKKSGVEWIDPNQIKSAVEMTRASSSASSILGGLFFVSF